MLYNQNDTYGINNALDNWITREDGSVYDDGYSFEEKDCFEEVEEDE